MTMMAGARPEPLAPLLPTTSEVRELAEEVVVRAGGRIYECQIDEQQLFLRGLLPMEDEVRAKDVVQAGVALMTVGEDIRIHPYTLRQLCTNGGIRAHAIQTRTVRRVGFSASSDAISAVVADVREAIQACSQPEVFAQGLKEMKFLTQTDARLTALFLDRRRFARRDRTRIRATITQRFHKERDRSAFGLMQAITSVGRDERDPRTKWYLEELGGSLSALLGPFGSPYGGSLRRTVQNAQAEAIDPPSETPTDEVERVHERAPCRVFGES